MPAADFVRRVPYTTVPFVNSMRVAGISVGAGRTGVSLSEPQELSGRNTTALASSWAANNSDMFGKNRNLNNAKRVKRGKRGKHARRARNVKNARQRAPLE
jgi:hypothetical protein